MPGEESGCEADRYVGCVYDGAVEGGFSLAGGGGFRDQNEAGEQQKGDFHQGLHGGYLCNSIIVHRKGKTFF